MKYYIQQLNMKYSSKWTTCWEIKLNELENIDSFGVCF